MGSKILKEFGERLKGFRDRSEKKISEIIKTVQVSKASYYNLEKGEASPSLDNLHEICEAFNCDMMTLLGQKKDPSEFSVLTIKAARLVEQLPDDHKKMVIYLLRGLKFQLLSTETNDSTYRDDIREIFKSH